MNSAADSALVSQYSSRATTPIHYHHHQHQQLNPYRLPRFWRGYVLGGLSTIGAYGLYKLGSLIKNSMGNNFHRKFNMQPFFQLPPPPPKKPTPKQLALPTPTPKQTPKPTYKPP